MKKNTWTQIEKFLNTVENRPSQYGSYSSICRCNSYLLRTVLIVELPFPAEVYDDVNPKLKDHTFIKGKAYGMFQMDMVDSDLAKKVWNSNLFY